MHLIGFMMLNYLKFLKDMSTLIHLTGFMIHFHSSSSSFFNKIVHLIRASPAVRVKGECFQTRGDKRFI